MDFSSLTLFQVMKAKMAYLSQRQGVLAQNVANADTPGYRAKDVMKPDFKKMIAATGGGSVHKVAIERTNPGHMSGMKMDNNQFTEFKRKNTDELNPNGNNVSIEEEMVKVADNQQEYQKVVSIYAKTVSLLKTAVSGQSSSGG